MSDYKQLNQAQKYQIESLKKAGKYRKEMTALLGYRSRRFPGN